MQRYGDLYGKACRFVSKVFKNVQSALSPSLRGGLGRGSHFVLRELREDEPPGQTKNQDDDCQHNSCSIGMVLDSSLRGRQLEEDTQGKCCCWVVEMGWYLIGETGGEHHARCITDASTYSKQGCGGNGWANLSHDDADGIETGGTETV